MRFKRMLIVPTLVGASFFFLSAGYALAAPSSTQSATSSTRTMWRGWCGGPATSGAQMLRNLNRYGIRSQLEAYYHVDNVNQTLESLFADFQVATLARPMLQSDNNGCNPGNMFHWTPRHKNTGDKMIVRGRDLRAKFPNGYSLTAKPGWDRKMVELETQGQADCSNPGRGKGWFWVWLPPSPVKATPQPKPVPVPQPTPCKCTAPAPKPKPTPCTCTSAIFGSKIAKIDGNPVVAQFYLQLSQGIKRYPVVPVTSGTTPKFLGSLQFSQPARACEVNVNHSLNGWTLTRRCVSFVPNGAKYIIPPFVNSKTTQPPVVAPPVAQPTPQPQPTPTPQPQGCTGDQVMNNLGQCVTQVTCSGNETSIMKNGVAIACQSQNQGQGQGQSQGNNNCIGANACSVNNPPAACPTGMIGTPPNGCHIPTCVELNNCPPSTVFVTGNTSVSSQKSATAFCPPAPSSDGSARTATSDVFSLTSPTFTGTGTSQAAAQSSLDSQLATWRAQNQGNLDSQAQSQANSRANSALTSCPKNGTSGAGSGSGSGPGAGGSGSSGSGAVCRDPNTGNIVPGNPDQFGYCV